MWLMKGLERNLHTPVDIYADIYQYFYKISPVYNNIM